jgi:hypothetical protein
VSKVEHFFNKKFVKDTIELSMIKNSDGTYSLFDKYQITLEDEKYKVDIMHVLDAKYFNTLKNAFTWIIFHKKNDFNKLNRIEYLDQKIEGVFFSIGYLKHMIEKTKNAENQVIYSAKLSQDQAVRKKLLSELNEFTEDAKFWHFKAFKAKEQN